MKKFFFFFIVFIFFTELSFADRIVYLNVDKIMQDSAAGKSIKKQLKKKKEANVAKFKKIEEDIKKKEKDIISKKNILSQDEFKKKMVSLRKDIVSYQKERNKIFNEINKSRINASTKLIKKLTPILEEYSKKNSISLIIQKKNIVIGKKNIDITPEIFDIVNKKIKDIKID